MFDQINLNLPYPQVEGVATEREVLCLYDFYAGRFSELTAITTYVYQSVILGDCSLSKLLNEISLVEMEHLNLLAKALVVFGADPVFTGKYNYFSCDYTNYSKDVRDFLTTNIQWEMDAEKQYKKLANETQNQSLSQLLTRIAMDEEMHAKLLTNAYLELFNEQPIL